MQPVSQCQQHSMSVMAALLNSMETAAKHAIKALILTLIDIVSTLFSAAGVMLAGIVALANIFLAGAKAIVELVAGVIGTIASTIQSLVNVFGGKCNESNGTVKALQEVTAWLIALRDKVQDYANRIDLWIQDVTELEGAITTFTSSFGPWATEYINAHIS